MRPAAAEEVAVRFADQEDVVVGPSRVHVEEDALALDVPGAAQLAESDLGPDIRARLVRASRTVVDVAADGEADALRLPSQMPHASPSTA